MTVLDNLVVKFSGDASGLIRAGRIGVRALQGVGRSAAQLGRLAAVGFTAASAAVIGFAEISRRSIDDTRKLAINLGVTAAQAQELKLAAELTGTSTDVMAKSVQQVTRALGDAARGNKTAADAIAALGLNAARLSELDSQLRFKTVITALGNMANESDRASVAAILLGRGWRELNPLIQDAGNVFARTDSVINGFGLGLNAADNTTEQLNDNLTELTTIGVALRDKVFEALAPRINETVQQLVSFTGQALLAAGGGEALADKLATKLVTAVRSLMNFFSALATLVRTVWGIVGPVLDAIGKAIGGIVAVAVQLSEGNFGGALTAGTAAVRDIVSGDSRLGGPQEETQQRQLNEQQQQTQLLRDLTERALVAVAG